MPRKKHSDIKAKFSSCKIQKIVSIKDEPPQKFHSTVVDPVVI